MVAGPKLVRTLEVANVLGESVLWNEKRRTVWWTDIESSVLFEYDPDADRLESWNTPHRVACFGFVEDKECLIVAFDRGIAYYDPPSGRTDWLVGPDALANGLRFNDGKVDPGGRFWVGTMVEDPAVASGQGALYCFDPNVGLVERINGVTISNGLCWSPDGTVMYHADSPRNAIFAYRFDAHRGTLSDRRIFARTPRDVHPDGSTVDTDWGVWNAQWGAGQVVRYAADGQPSLRLDLPVQQPTCVTFGGVDLDLLFVTSARQGLPEDDLADQPAAGDLFIFQTGFQGMSTCALR